VVPPLLTLQDIAVDLGDQTLLDGVELVVEARARICLVGQNGAGKSTLLRIMAGLAEPDRGHRFVQPGHRIAYLPQAPDFAGSETIAAYVGAAPAGAGAPPPHRVDAMLDALDLDGARKAATLSGGEARRAALARLLAGAPEIMLLDEPTNHLDLPAIEWLEATLAASPAAIVVVSHDRAFLNRLTRTTLWLDRGRLRRLDDGFAGFEAWSAEILEREASAAARLDKRIASETEWSHKGISARRKRNQGRLRRLQALRGEREQRVARSGAVALVADSGAMSGRLVVEAEAIGKAFDGQTVIADFSTRILRGDRVGVIGPNGAGKTTLLRLLSGALAPDWGRVRLGTNITAVYLDQMRATLDAAASVRETLCESGGDQVMVRGRPRHVVSYMRDFLFRPSQANSPVASLSGGERNRLLLARALARSANLLVLDEPTNDLDLETLDLLQEMLGDFDGTLLLVSHDRDFLDRVVTSTIALEGGGVVEEYVGGYSDYLRQRRPAALKPAAKATAPAAPRARRPATRLSYREQRNLEALPGRIAALEAEIATLEATLAEEKLYARDAAAFSAAATRLGAARAELSVAEEKWLALEIKREAISR
jgi:ABC transport system ATP-binding/permease protein